MLIPSCRTSLRLIAVIVAATFAALPAAADEPAHELDWLTMQDWLQRADTVANDRVTHALCGWGDIGLRQPFLQAADRAGASPIQLVELARRYDAAVRERRRLEAVMSLNSDNAPDRRHSGVHSTEGCSGGLRQRIQDRAHLLSAGPAPTDPQH